MKYTTEQATQKVIDTINTLQDAQSASIDKYMSRYACFREIAGTAEYETHYQNIAYALFGDYADDTCTVSSFDAAEDDEAGNAKAIENASTPEQIEEADADRPSAVIALFQKKLAKFNEGYHDYADMEQHAKQAKLPISEYIMTLLEITQNDIKKQPDGYRSKLYQELKMLHEQKILASNQHRQEHGHIDRWWFTTRGIKKLNKKYRFC